MFGINYIERTLSSENFMLAHNNKTAPIYVASNDYSGVVRAAYDLQSDIQRVTTVIPTLTHDLTTLTGDIVIIGTIGKSTVIDELIAEGKLDVKNVVGKWEASVIQTLENPILGINRALVIAGSDKRGTIFGIYDLSEKIGVSPWYWWADVPTQQHSTLMVTNGIYKQGEPSVKYRGIFLNDEGPSLMTWVRKNYQDFTHEFYEKVFELTLRLKANYHWPAMWDNTFYEDDPLNPAVAEHYGVVMGTSHHEPMMRPHGDWKIHKQGPWDYSINQKYLYKFWEHGIKRSKEYESIVTLGMRGDGDEAMGGQLTFQEKIDLLQKIVADQREMIAKHRNGDVSEIPQLWALYKEVQDYYESGMRVPDDITLLWSDDNFGNLRRVPTVDERQRSGGAGIYYHLDYVGGPRSYKWVNSVPLQKIWEQMHKAYEYGADRIWILNVGDLKPVEFQLEYFLRMAWNMNDFKNDRAWDYSVDWAKRHFGEKYATDIATIISKYSKFNGRLKPEQLNNVELYSQVNYNEADNILVEFAEITALAENIYDELPENLKDAFFQIVLYPTKASMLVTELYLQVEKNKLYAKQGRTSTNVAATKAELLFAEDASLSFDYNKRTALGKWNHMMDQTHIGYTYWQQPEENTMPEVYRVSISENAVMGVSPTGLVQVNNYTREKQYFDIFNKGLTPFTFKVDASENWIIVSMSYGLIVKEKKLSIDIDWDNAPNGIQVTGNVTIRGSEGSIVILPFQLFNPVEPARESLVGFIETDGYISIEAEHFTNKVNVGGAGWELIPDYGRTLSSLAVFPVTTPSAIPPEKSPCLEYQVYIINPGKLKVTTLVAPTLNFISGKGVRIGISFDNEPIQIIDAVNYLDDGSFNESDWEKSVIVNIREVHSTHQINESGYHTLKIWMVDPIVSLQKILIDTGGLKPSYLGAPESYYGNKPEDRKSQLEVFHFDPYTIPGTISPIQDTDRLDVFVETSGLYRLTINAIGSGVFFLNCDEKKITEKMSLNQNELTRFEWDGISLEAGNHMLQVIVVEGFVEIEYCQFEISWWDLFKIRPSLRFEDENIIIQIGLFNEDIYSHRFTMKVSLLNSEGQLVGTTCTPGIAQRNSKEMYNYCFEAIESDEMILIVELTYKNQTREYTFHYNLN